MSVFTKLSHDFIIWILANYNIVSENIKVTEVVQWVDNSIFLIEDLNNDTKYIFKFFESKPIDKIENNIWLYNFLFSTWFISHNWIADKNGIKIWIYDWKCFWILNFIKNKHEDYELKKVRDIILTFHTLIGDYYKVNNLSIFYDQTKILDEMERETNLYFTKIMHSNVVPFGFKERIRKLYSIFVKKLKEIEDTRFKFEIWPIHNDIMPWNLLIKENWEYELIDYDGCNINLLAKDYCIAYLRFWFVEEIIRSKAKTVFNIPKDIALCMIEIYCINLILNMIYYTKIDLKPVSDRNFDDKSWNQSWQNLLKYYIKFKKDNE